jgi:hypothetical protein
VILAVAGVIGLIQALGLTFVVESPKWMALHGNPTRARRNLQKIRGDTAIEGEVDLWDVEGIRSKWRPTIRRSGKFEH